MNDFIKYLSVVIFTFFTLPVIALDDAVSTGISNDTAIDGYDTVAYFTQGNPSEGDKNSDFYGVMLIGVSSVKKM